MRFLALLFLFPLTVFGTITATDRGTGNNNVAGTTVVCSPTSTIAVGSTGVFTIAMDNAGGASTDITGTSITDSVGNVWYLRGSATSGTANNNVEVAVYTSVLTAQLTSSDTITVSLANSTTAKAWSFVEATPSAGNVALVVLSPPTSVVNGSSTTGSPTMSTPEVDNAGLIVAFGGAQSGNTWTGDADTSDGSWSTMQVDAAGTGASGITIISQQKVVTAYNAQTFNPTLTSAVVRLGYVSFVEADIKGRAAGGSVTGEAATTITFSRPIASGSLAVLALSAANMGSGGSAANIPTSGTDSKSNTWTLQQTLIFDPGAAGAGVEVGLYTSVLTTPIVVGDTLALTYQAVNVPEKTWAVWEFAPAGAGVMTYVTGGVGSGSNTASPSTTTASITSGDYVVAMVGNEAFNNWTGDADTTDGTWTTQLAHGRGATTSTSQSLTTQWKKVTATATQTYNPTSSGAVDTAPVWIEINDSSVVGPTAAQQSAFFFLFP